jgi:hypothetical protein
VSASFAGGGYLYAHADPELTGWKTAQARMFITRVHVDTQYVECREGLPSLSIIGVLKHHGSSRHDNYMRVCLDIRNCKYFQKNILEKI